MMRHLFALTILLFAESTLSEDNLPTRSDCIVMIDFQAGHALEFSIQDSNGISDFIGEGINNADQTLFMGGFFNQTVSENNIKIYIQYKKHCDYRHELASQIINSVEIKISIPVSYAVSREKIEPGLDTIELRGDSWID